MITDNKYNKYRLDVIGDYAHKYVWKNSDFIKFYLLFFWIKNSHIFRKVQITSK